jgi:hypothetical protein
VVVGTSFRGASLSGRIRPEPARLSGGSPGGWPPVVQGRFQTFALLAGSVDAGGRVYLGQKNTIGDHMTDAHKAGSWSPFPMD